jgi:hypothetical protein
MSLKLDRIKLALPWIGEIELRIDKKQIETAWIFYIELVTRIATVEMDIDAGSDREAMNSLYQLFTVTRGVLREAGPEAGIGDQSVAGVAIEILNKGLRPFLSKWHPMLQEHEAQRPPNTGVAAWERQWSEHGKFREALAEMQRSMRAYAGQLKRVVDEGFRVRSAGWRPQPIVWLAIMNVVRPVASIRSQHFLARPVDRLTNTNAV